MGLLVVTMFVFWTKAIRSCAQQKQILHRQQNQGVQLKSHRPHQVVG